MKEILLVGIGGGLGAICRYLCTRIISSKIKRRIPYHTFIINITGCLLLGYFTYTLVDKNLVSLIEVGFMGGFTTYSTFMVESFSLVKDHGYVESMRYILLSTAVGSVMFFIGMSVAMI